MDSVNIFGKMEVHIKENINMEKDKDLGNSKKNYQRRRHTRDILDKI